MAAILHTTVIWILVIFICVLLIYDVVWGPHKGTFRGREFRYRDSTITPITDDAFYEQGHFAERNIPKDYAIAKRIELADAILDYPPERLLPDMTWKEVPLESCQSIFPILGSEDDLAEYVEHIGFTPASSLADKTVAEIIELLFALETALPWTEARLKPIGWEHEYESLMMKIERGELSAELLTKASIADSVIRFYRMRTEQRKP